MRIKDYADSLGVSSQSIYKRIRSPKYKERLKGHLYRLRMMSLNWKKRWVIFKKNSSKKRRECNIG